jgi:hypothetical protein
MDNCENCGAPGVGMTPDEVALCAECGKELNAAALTRIASGRDCILSIICATKHEAHLIAAAAMWTAASVPGCLERTFAINKEGEGWRVAVALHVGPGGVERLEYDDVDGLIDYLDQE